MRVGWLCDLVDTAGGAELTAEELAAAAPDGVDLVACPPGGVVEGLDRYVVHNCLSYPLEDLWAAEGVPTFKVWHDVGPHVNLGVRGWLDRHANAVCCSPLQRDRMGLNGDTALVPPPVDLERFRKAAEGAQERAGAVAVGPWMNWGKAPHRAREMAPDVDFYGGGPCAPTGSQQVPYDQLPAILARYETFVHLPTVLEPFGRTVVEAWAAGLRIVTNRLVGARYWIEEAPDRLDSAANDFWALVTDG